MHSRALLVLEMRVLRSLDRFSDVGLARARVAKERKAKRVILTGENMVDWYGRKNPARDTKAKEKGVRALQDRRGIFIGSFQSTIIQPGLSTLEWCAERGVDQASTKRVTCLRDLAQCHTPRQKMA